MWLVMWYGLAILTTSCTQCCMPSIPTARKQLARAIVQPASHCATSEFPGAIIAMPSGLTASPGHAEFCLAVAIVHGGVENRRLAVDAADVAAPQVTVQHAWLDLPGESNNICRVMGHNMRHVLGFRVC